MFKSIITLFLFFVATNATLFNFTVPLGETNNGKLITKTFTSLALPMTTSFEIMAFQAVFINESSHTQYDRDMIKILSVNFAVNKPTTRKIFTYTLSNVFEPVMLPSPYVISIPAGSTLSMSISFLTVEPTINNVSLTYYMKYDAPSNAAVPVTRTAIGATANFTAFNVPGTGNDTFVQQSNVLWQSNVEAVAFQTVASTGVISITLRNNATSQILCKSTPFYSKTGLLLSMTPCTSPMPLFKGVNYTIAAVYNNTKPIKGVFASMSIYVSFPKPTTTTGSTTGPKPTTTTSSGSTTGPKPTTTTGTTTGPKPTTTSTHTTTGPTTTGPSTHTTTGPTTTGPSTHTTTGLSTTGPSTHTTTGPTTSGPHITTGPPTTGGSSSGKTSGGTSGGSSGKSSGGSSGKSSGGSSGKSSGGSSGKSSGGSSGKSSSSGHSSSGSHSDSSQSGSSQPTGSQTGSQSGSQDGSQSGSQDGFTTTGSQTGSQDGGSSNPTTTGQTSGQTSGSQTSGQSTGQTTGQTSGQSTGQTSGQTSGQTTGGASSGQTSGQTTGGASSGQTSGQSTGSSGQTSGQTTGGTGSSTSGQTTGGYSSGGLENVNKFQFNARKPKFI